MSELVSLEILQIWERGRDEHRLTRPLTVLELAAPERSREEWATMSLGRRNERLLEIEAQSFGQRLVACSECPGCEELLELEIDAASLLPADQRAGWEDTYTMSRDGFEVRFRLLTTLDLLTASRCADVASARELLLDRCVLAAFQGENEVVASELPSAVVAELANAMDHADPGAEALASLLCPVCSHRWQASLDVGAFVWEQVGTHARCLLSEIHDLALAYGWSEPEILALGHWRRQAYLELVRG